jgi:glycosyltransferase involved in cell wall biosynthesis
MLIHVSAIVPAYNEAENIALVVAGLFALRYEPNKSLIDEVTIADNNSNGDTASIAAS